MSDPRVEVRPARPADLERVWPLARDFATSFTPRHAAFGLVYAQLLGRADTLLLVADVDQNIGGYLLASDHLTFQANGPVCWVEEVMVVPEHRRLGVGRALMDRAEWWAVQRGSAYVSLASRRAGEFYVAVGYEKSALFYKKTLR
jgi:GNAT superfamily N-acetyltransferase